MTALEKFGLPETATPKDVKSAWRCLAAIQHPDKGGDAAEFSRLHKLYLEALSESLEAKPCKVCKGSGKLTQSSGFSTVHMTCPVCSGLGHQGISK